MAGDVPVTVAGHEISRLRVGAHGSPLVRAVSPSRARREQLPRTSELLTGRAVLPRSLQLERKLRHTRHARTHRADTAGPDNAGGLRLPGGGSDEIRVLR